MKFGQFLRYWPAFTAVSAALMAAGVIFFCLRKSSSPDQLEGRRREMIDRVGKMGDGVITEMQGSLISYTYQVRGIEYHATQDIAGIDIDLPPEQWGTIHAVSVKFDPRNPANSLIMSRKWSGLPKHLTTKLNL